MNVDTKEMRDAAGRLDDDGLPISAQLMRSAANELDWLRPEVARLKAQVEAVANAETESCSRCEGNGRLYADGKAHYYSEGAPTKPCPECDGEGRIPVDWAGLQEQCRAALAPEPESEKCVTCEGNGKDPRNEGALWLNMKPCPGCGGTGRKP